MIAQVGRASSRPAERRSTGDRGRVHRKAMLGSFCQNHHDPPHAPFLFFAVNLSPSLSRNSVPVSTASSWQARIGSVGPAFRLRGALIDPTSSDPESLWEVSGQTVSSECPKPVLSACQANKSQNRVTLSDIHHPLHSIV